MVSNTTRYNVSVVILLRHSRTKVDIFLNSLEKLINDFPQGSAWGSLLFNIYSSNLFYFTGLAKICNFADNTTFHACDNDLKTLVMRVEHDGLLATEWFENKNMKLKKEKFLLSRNKFLNFGVKMGEEKLNKGKTKITSDRNRKKLRAFAVQENRKKTSIISKIFKIYKFKTKSNLNEKICGI